MHRWSLLVTRAPSCTLVPFYTYTHSSHTPSHTHTPSDSHIPSHTHPPTHTTHIRSLSHPLTHTLTPPHTHTHTSTPPHTHSLSLTHTHPSHPLTHPHSHAESTGWDSVESDLEVILPLWSFFMSVSRGLIYLSKNCVWSVCSGQQANKFLPITGLIFQWRKTVINK